MQVHVLTAGNAQPQQVGAITIDDHVIAAAFTQQTPLTMALHRASMVRQTGFTLSLIAADQRTAEEILACLRTQI